MEAAVNEGKIASAASDYRHKAQLCFNFAACAKTVGEVKLATEQLPVAFVKQVCLVLSNHSLSEVPYIYNKCRVWLSDLRNPQREDVTAFNEITRKFTESCIH